MYKLFFNNKARLLNFHHWERLGYSLFQALKQEVHIASLAVAYLYVATPSEAFAQHTADSLKIAREYELDEVEVSAQRAPATYSQIARIVSVIDRKGIEAAPVASVQDLLEYALGVDIRQRGTYGVQADISVRGGSFDQTLVLLNGVNISDPQSGHHNLNLPLSLKAVKRIEILNGSSARVYGPNAFTGAINIITEPDSINLLSADASFGSHGLRDINVNGNVQTGKLQNFIAIGNTASNGYRPNTDFTNSNVFYNGKLKTDEATINFQAGYINKGFGANGFYSPAYPNQYESTRTAIVSAGLETGKKLHTSASTYWRRNHDRYELFRSDPADWYTGHNYHMTDVFGLKLNTWLQWKLGKTSLGSELRSENILSNQLGESLDESISVPGEDGQFFTNGHSRTNLSYFIEHSAYINRFSISAGLMANWISDLQEQWHFYPGVDLSYQITNNWKIYGTFNQSLRMPTYTDLYYVGPSNLGNPNLKPEHSTSFEGGVKFKNQFMNLEAATYYRIGKDIIDWVRISDDFLWQTDNLTQINAAGFEVKSDISIQRWLNNEHFFINRLCINYAYNEITRKESEYISNYTLDNLKHKLVVGINHRIYKNLSADWQFRYEDRNGGYSNFDGTDYTGEVDYKPFGLLDLKVNYHYKNFRFFAMATNLFNTTYYDLSNIPQAGRWISGGVSCNLK
ncbi:MAG: TonB-dependent receptor plug domain-containing protein [Mangrovibacterium sp.]